MAREVRNSFFVLLVLFVVKTIVPRYRKKII